MKVIKHVFWDWNGTLFNDVELCLNLGNKLLKQRGLPLMSLDTYRDYFELPVKKYYENAGFDFTKESFELVGRIWMNDYETQKYSCNLFEGISDVLTFFKENGIKQSILSAYSLMDLKDIIKYYKIDHFFENVKGLDHIYADSKLHLGKELLEETKLSTDEILFVGDTHHDYEVAVELGVKSILFSQGHQSKEKLLKFNVPVIDNIKDLVNYL